MIDSLWEGVDFRPKKGNFSYELGDCLAWRNFKQLLHAQIRPKNSKTLGNNNSVLGLSATNFSSNHYLWWWSGAFLKPRIFGVFRLITNTFI